jgi:UDPglucose 6-dehydrogenase
MNLEGEGPRCIVVGAGYVGLATAAALSRDWEGGLVVTDQNAARLEEHHRAIADGRDPLGERGLGRALEGVRFDPRPNYTSAVVFVCVGTPAKQGTLDCEAVREVVLKALDHDARLVVIRSTVTPAFVRGLLDQVRDLGPHATGRVAVAPEFLREGHAVNDARHPSRIVVGADDRATAETVYQMLYGHRHLRIEDAFSIVSLHQVTPIEAALVKLGSNAMLAMRVWFADAIASSCERLPGGNSGGVLNAIGADPRIGHSQLRPGLGVGGPCLPKDSLALINDQDAFEPLLEVILAMDDDVIGHLVDQIRAERPPRFDRVALIVGMGFKPDSPDWRNSPAVELAIQLAADRQVVVFDSRLSAAEQAELQEELVRRCLGTTGDIIPIVAPTLGGVSRVDVLVAAERTEAFAEELLGALETDALLVDPHRLLNAVGRGIGIDGYQYLGRGFGPR